jgi:hypothetical protein
MNMSQKSVRLLGALCACIVLASSAQAQIDPAPRQLLHLGFDQSLKDDGPMGAYVFYYWNIVDVPTTNQNLRLAIAPGYVDGELGFKKLINDTTDVGLGFSGGLFANSYNEVDGGNYIREESFNGDGAGISLSVYHLFNPGGMIPLSGILRSGVEYQAYTDGGDTANHFEIPHSQPFIVTRTGLRWGGKEPMLGPRLAMELSGWYEMQCRTKPDDYGYNGDHSMEATTHQLWMRAQINFTTLKYQHYIVAGIQAGTVLNPDRLSAFRVGGVLPYTSEFPLYMPGYFNGELSTRNFGELYGVYTIPLDEAKQWQILGMAATGVMDYVDGTGQGGAWNSGVGVGGAFTSSNRRWRIANINSYGINAKRTGGDGGYSLALMFQYNFGSTDTASEKAFEQLEKAKGFGR